MLKNQTSKSNIQVDSIKPRLWDRDRFPVHQELIDLNQEISRLKSILTKILIDQGVSGIDVSMQGISSQAKSNSLDQLTDEQMLYTQIVLKIHQFFALVELDYKKAPLDHIQDIVTQIEKKGGLQYISRAQSIEGRLLDHAAECKTLVKHIFNLKDIKVSDVTLSNELFYVTCSENESGLQVNKEFIMMTLSANGKAELYFHAYLWTKYFQMLSCPELLKIDEVKLIAKIAETPGHVLEKIKKFPFGESEYEQLVAEFGSLRPGKRSQIIQHIQHCLFAAQITDNKQSLYLIEKLLIQLLGYPDINCRDYAVMLLNSLYDNNDWQQSVAFRPVIRCIGQHFKVNLTVKINGKFDNKQKIFLGLSAPSPLSTTHETTLTWHKIDQRNIVFTNENETEISINFGKFWKCGYYDWRLMMLENGKFQTVLLTKPPVLHNFPLSNSTQYDNSDNEDSYDQLIAQGRYIIQSQGLRDEIFHEVQVDNKPRNTFVDVKKAMQGYKESGVTVVYLMGILERDNCPIQGSANEAFYSQSNIKMMRRETASPLAVISRDTPCEMLGGISGFKSLMQEAKKQNVKIVCDCLARISSTRHHRKYRQLLLQYLDLDGRRHICYGTDGHAIKYEDTAMLNYRKIEAWEILVNEVLSLTAQTGIDGIHLDNGQAWPQIFEPDLDELTRKDSDGKPAYTAQERMDGEIVIRNENYGYWQTNNMEWYANPFFVKLCRRIWSEFPNFMIVGECWGGFKFEHRQIILARSGVIPRLFKLPQTICSIFGKKLHRDGRVTKSDTKDSVTAIKNWYDESHLQVPEGTIMIQSSTANSWPYPAYLFGRGTWAAVDILYLMPDIPMTFNQEVTGEVYKLGQQGSVHQADLLEIKSGNEIKKSNSQIRLALEMNDDEQDKTETATQVQKIRSASNLAALVLEESKNDAEVQIKQLKFREQIGPDFGFDLSKINTHYEHRRALRQQKMVLRYGLMCPLVALHKQNESLPDVLVFARYSLMETAIIAINLSDQEKTFWIDLDNLSKLFSKTLSDNVVVVTTGLLPSKKQVADKQEYYFLREFTKIKHVQTLIPYGTSIQIVTVCQDDKQTFQNALTNSFERIKDKLKQGQDIEADQFSLLLRDCILKKSDDGAYFAGLVTSLKESFLDKINMQFLDFVLKNTQLTSDPKLFAVLMALCKNVSVSKSKAAADCQVLVENNKLGPLVFCTPEIGRWSTVGGLGVMVDELSLGLAQLGQEVIVISPYYDRNRRGQTGYLSQDPSGIYYVDNITITLDKPYTLGVHEGIVGGVKVVFLHHSDIFPIPYAEISAVVQIRQIAIFAKACLEYCCKRQVIPSICITNDWFTGLIPAYAKVGAFGPTFYGTTFLHICHNLMEDYEGRIYPEPKDGYFYNIHQLPKEWLIDPLWTKNMINPSRTAIMLSDQWATVSISYRDDLLNQSPLSPLLKQKPQPFAYPNGIPILDRLKKLETAAPDHFAAKKLIQQKYFNFQELDDSIPIFAFVGRVTKQKGVHLILDIVEDLIHKYQFKVQFLIGGPANMRDPYSANCAHRMWCRLWTYAKFV